MQTKFSIEIESKMSVNFQKRISNKRRCYLFFRMKSQWNKNSDMMISQAKQILWLVKNMKTLAIAIREYITGSKSDMNYTLNEHMKFPSEIVKKKDFSRSEHYRLKEHEANIIGWRNSMKRIEKLTLNSTCHPSVDWNRKAGRVIKKEKIFQIFRTKV